MTTNDEKPAERDRGGRVAPTWAEDRERSPDPAMVERWAARLYAVARRERDRLRAGVESVMATLEASHQATALGSIDEPGRSKALAEDDAYRRLRALLAGSGEQPGACGHDFNALVDVDEEGHAVCSECEPSLSDRPAPVAPDSPDVRDITDQVRYAWCWYGGATREESDRRAAQFDTWLASLAVVGQGVTAEAVRDRIADEVDRDSSFFAELERLLERAGSNPSTTADAIQDRLVERIRRAVVRPTGQEQADG